ncbi:MAG: VOC family protein [Rhodospirillales bacterium]|nr:VOC family protein [Rhodospirillales bacterium]
MKLHVSMRVADYEKAVAFYSGLFGQEPSVTRENYAKWDVEDPSVNFVIESERGEPGFDHIGIQVADHDELNTVADRMRAMDRPFLDIEQTTCCFARMEKAWVKGEANDAWETFLTHSHDAEEYGVDRSHLLDRGIHRPSQCP